MRRSLESDLAGRRLTAYLRQWLGPRLLLPSVFEEIERTSWRPSGGVFVVRPQGAAPLALRLLSDQGRAERYVRAARLAESKRLPTPRLVFADTSREHHREHGFSIVVERLIEGAQISRHEMDDAHRSALARTLAQTHSVESARWGAPGSFQFRFYFDRELIHRAEKRLRSVQTFDDSFRPEWRSRIERFFRARRSRWSIEAPYALTHDKINPGNVIFTDDGRAHLIDLRGMTFGSIGKDLAAALSFFCQTPEQVDAFKTVYFAGVGPRWRDHYERHEPVYQVCHHLTRWAARSRDASAVEKIDDAQREERRAQRRRERDLVWRWLDQSV